MYSKEKQNKCAVGERSVSLYGSENVGLSNENIGENPMPRKPKVSDARFVHVGLVRT